MGNVFRIFASVGEFLRREFVAAWPVFLFFLVGFLLLFLLIKLALANFSIEVTALPKAVVGALFAAKAALILDETPLARRLERYRRIVAVAVKTFLYGSITAAGLYRTNAGRVTSGAQFQRGSPIRECPRECLSAIRLGTGNKSRVCNLFRVVRDR